MNMALQFHDSEVLRVESNEGVLRVVFAAAFVHRTTGLDSEKYPQAGYVHALEMVFAKATWTGSPLSDCLGRLSAGHVMEHADKARRSCIDLPFASRGPVSAELQFANGSLLSIAAEALVCQFTGEPRFSEPLSC
ncbi:MAG: hypothetical protein EOP38_25425 [Rubrivivax sp.]|nr:MAG: hypothetical protein EOP38_25425 [Rubrivivax sp.]